MALTHLEGETIFPFSDNNSQDDQRAGNTALQPGLLVALVYF